jgi:hypothetical protein
MSVECQQETHAPQQTVPYSITSSARASSVEGTSKPSAIAVIRLGHRRRSAAMKNKSPFVRCRTEAPAKREETPPMSAIGAVFQPELIELMNAVLDDATAMLPEAKRTSTMKAEIASHILACAAKGERNPMTLKIAALSAVVECTHYSHDISPERRAV